jgi:hypothetical protein
MHKVKQNDGNNSTPVVRYDQDAVTFRVLGARVHPGDLKVGVHDRDQRLVSGIPSSLPSLTSSLSPSCPTSLVSFPVP